MNFIAYLENWERRNWYLFFRWLIRWRHYLRWHWRLVKQTTRLALFFTYIVLSRLVSLLRASLGGYSREIRFHVSPEAPSLCETEHQWALKQKVGPNVFLR